MGEFIFGVLLLLVGAGLVLAGLRVFFLMLPIWGFVSGFFIGGIAFSNLVGDGFLATVGVWLVATLVGILFGVFSYLYWYAGALVTAGSVGALAGSGLLALFNVNTAWIVLLFSIIGFALFALVAYVINLPVYVVAVNTAIAGAVALVTGLLLMFNRIGFEQLGYGGAWAFINDSWFWLLLWIAVAAFGISIQWRIASVISLPAERWVRADTTVTSPSTAPTGADAA